MVFLFTKNYLYMDKIVIDEKQFDFLSADLPRPVAYLRRINQGGKRFYYTYDEETSNVKVYSSGTTLISDGYAENTQFLEDWRNKLKAEGKNPKDELDYLAMRGTLLHILLGDYIQGLEINLENLNEYFSKNHTEIIDEKLYLLVLLKDAKWLVKGIIAFAQFVKDYNVKPLAIELMMKSDVYDVATAVDLICTMDVEEKGFFGEVYKTGEKKGQPKESKQVRTVLAIVDFKSTQSGFFDKHYFQLQLNKRIVKENYPDLDVEMLFNWSPKDWTSSPTYNLKEQSDGRLDALCEPVFEQGKIKHSFKTPTIDVINSAISLGSFDPSVSFYTKVPIQEYLKEVHGERKTD